jgi:hypothetical protein
METTRENFLWKYVDISELDAIEDIKNIFLKKKPITTNFYIPMDIEVTHFLGMEISSPVLINVMPNKRSMIHIDHRTDRMKLALNIPIINCDNTVTEFWQCTKTDPNELPEDPLWRGPLFFNGINCKKIDEYTLTRPIIFNTQVPHSVFNFSDRPRLALSLRFKEDPWHLVGL